MNEAAILGIVVFIGGIIITSAALRWLVHEICDAAGLSIFEYIEKRRKIRFGFKHPKAFYNLLVKSSLNSKPVKRLLFFFHIFFIPSIAGLILSVIGIFTHTLDALIGNLEMLSVMTAVFAGFGAILNAVFNRNL